MLKWTFGPIISSKENQYVKLVRGLARKKQRDAEGLFLAEGLTNIREALSSPIEAELLLVDAEAEGKESVRQLAAMAAERGARLAVVEHRLIQGLSQTEANQGLILALRQPKLGPEDFGRAARGKAIAVLDGLQDPGNVGTILRTAWAAGLGGVLFSGEGADPYGPKVVRAAMGALYHLPVLALPEEEAWELIRRFGWELACADARGVDFRRCRFAAGKQPAWLLGREACGPSHFWTSRAELKVAIPMQAGVDSLNVAVAAGILFFSGAGGFNEL